MLAEAKVWRAVTMMMEGLVGDAHIQMKRKILKTAASITIATWLDELHDLKGKITSRKTASIILSCTTSEGLREADVQFKQKINAARGTTLWTDRQGVEEQAVDTSTEEPPD